MPEGSPSYPATFSFDPPAKVANWRPLVNWLLAIPHFVILYVLQTVSQVIGIISWFAIVFTGKLPDGLANLQVMYLRYALRTYLYAGFQQDPPRRPEASTGFGFRQQVCPGLQQRKPPQHVYPVAQQGWA